LARAIEPQRSILNRPAWPCSESALPLAFNDLGEQQVKNITQPIRLASTLVVEFRR